MYGKKLLRALAIAGVAFGGVLAPNAWASSVPPFEIFIDDPAGVLMVDGADRHPGVAITARLDAPSHAAFDFGFMSHDAYVPVTRGGRTSGQYTFAGGTPVDFALRNRGADSLFGTADDLIYRLSDNADYADQRYSSPIDSSRSRNPVVAEPYFRDLRLRWDLNLDGAFDARTVLEIRESKFDGMTAVPLAVPLPKSAWLLGSGLVVFGAIRLRRITNAANTTSACAGT